MNPLEEREISCPHCGEAFTIVIDCTIQSQNYIEDCYVCCSPIDISVEVLADTDSTAEELLIQVTPAQ